MLPDVLSPAPAPPAPWRGWAGFRALLLIVTAVVVVTALGWGRHDATVQDLQNDVVNGRVARVEITGDLPPGSTGTVEQTVTWRSGWQAHQAQVQLVSGSPDSTGATTGDDSSVTVTRQDVGSSVREWDPSVRVIRMERGSRPDFSGSLLGVDVPGWVSVLTVAQWLGAVFLLVNGPDPRRVSRWGWFWLFAVPFGVTVFLLSSGPLPGRRYVAPGPRRWGGWRAFLVSLVLTGVLGGSGSL